MRQLTYTQAATCGENLKVLVTPEQSEKMQKAWFKAGKTWCGGSIYKPLLLLKNNLTAALNETHFSDSFCEQIELIDDLPQSGFTGFIRVNGIEVPAPLDSLDGLDACWAVSLRSNQRTIKIEKLTYREGFDCCTQIWLQDGLCYATKEDAVKRAEAMLKFEEVQ